MQEVNQDKSEKMIILAFEIILLMRQEKRHSDNRSRCHSDTRRSRVVGIPLFDRIHFYQGLVI